MGPYRLRETAIAVEVQWLESFSIILHVWKGKDDFIIPILTSKMFFKNLVWELEFIDLILVLKVVWSEFVWKTLPYFSEG